MKERNELDSASRDIQLITLPRWGRVAEGIGPVPWLVFDDEGGTVEPIRMFLVDFVARNNRPGSVRSYAFDLLRWWRWLRVVQVDWDRATSAEVRDFVLWLRIATKPRTSARTQSAATARDDQHDHEEALPGRPLQAAHGPAQQHRDPQLLPLLDRVGWRSTGQPGAAGPEREAAPARPPQSAGASWSRTAAKGDCATNPRSPGAGPGRCRTSVGMSCSRPCAPTGTGRSSPWG
ncbi:site-specific integrase [Streptomyces vinaceus]|uniref:site-specific integrase n=1 Tax=Streptomyces vinaceus TaxID=1960 RepID=UPI0035DD6C77